jgi:flagellar hook assembly protein FlgD
LRRPTDVQQIDLPIVPDEFSLEQKYPNPFNPTTEIIYSLPKETEVTLAVYNTIGQKALTLVSEKQATGKYRVRWSGLDQNGKNLPTGIYLYRLETSEFTSAKKMLMVK